MNSGGSYQVNIFVFASPSAALMMALALLSWNASFASNTINLEQAFRYAAEKTEPVKVAESHLADSKAVEKQLRGTFHPKLHSITSNSLFEGRDTRLTSRIQLSQPLYLSHRYFANSTSTREVVKAREKAIERTKLELYTLVVQTFYDVRLAEAEVENYKSTMALTEERLIELKKRARIGRSRTGEVLTAQSQLSMIEANLEDARRRVKVAREQFSFITGLPTSTELFASEDTSKPKPIEDYLSKIKFRPDLLELEHLTEAARANVSLSKADHYPSANLTANGYLLRQNPSSETTDWDVSVVLTIPLYEGGVVQSQVEKARANELTAQLLLQQRRRESEADIRSAHAALSSSLEQIQLLQESVKTYEKNYQEQARDYRLGLVTNLDVLQSLNSLQDAKLSFARTRIRAQLNRASLDIASGIIPN